MKKIINLSFLLPLYYFLLSMTDEELDEFDINDGFDRGRLLSELKLQFDRFGPLAQVHVINGLEYMLASKTFLEYWEAIIPHEVPIDDVLDKGGYVHDLFVRLAGREPNKDFDMNVELINELELGALRFTE